MSRTPRPVLRPGHGGHETAGARLCRHARTALLALCAAATLGGCASMGPGTIARDRFDYSGAVATSWQRQLLLNMVKLRYADTPLFLDVASVINQYALVGDVDLSAGINSSLTGGDTASIGATGRYEDRPTVTYSPVVGEKFTRSILTPLPPASIFSMIQAGWPADLVFRLAVRAINGVYGPSGDRSIARPADPEYYLLIEALRNVQSKGAMSMRLTRDETGESALLFFRGPRSLEAADDIELARNILGLRRGADRLTLAYGSVAANDMEIAMLTRSMIEILTNLADTIHVPSEHVMETRTQPTFVERSDDGTDLDPLIRVHSSAQPPGDAYVAVPYRDHWFWIDDRDLASKRMFSFLLFMFSLAESGRAPAAPVVTISAGGG